MIFSLPPLTRRPAEQEESQKDRERAAYTPIRIIFSSSIRYSFNVSFVRIARAGIGCNATHPHAQPTHSHVGSGEHQKGRERNAGHKRRWRCQHQLIYSIWLTSFFHGPRSVGDGVVGHGHHHCHRGS